MDTTKLYIGRTVDSEQPLQLDPNILLKHVMVLGASGSGKTFLSKVVVEEAIRNNIPVIAIDSQGDLASLGLSGDPDELKTRSLPAWLPAEYWNKLDFKVWTPGSTYGLPLSMQPNLDLGMYDRHEDRVRAVHGMASELAGFAGFSDEGIIAGISKMIDFADEHDLMLSDLEDVCDFLKDPPDALCSVLENIFPEKDRKKLLKALIIKMNGPRQLLLEGMPINVDALFGYDEGGAYDNGRKVRVSVICLNALHSLEEKQLFIAALARAVYGWMIQEPHSKPVGLFFLDEAAPFIPPVRKPPCKESLMMLLRQARKYGVSMLIATQSPGDLDYTGLAQIGTKFLGRMTQRQESYKVAPLLSDTENGDELIESLPGLQQGQFVAVCPDAFPEPVMFKSRWLVTRHKTLSLEQISELVTDDDRAAYG